MTSTADGHLRRLDKAGSYVCRALGLALLLFCVNACAQPDVFLAELAAAPRPSGASGVDVTPIVKKHIPVGMPVSEAQKFLESRGFKWSLIRHGSVPVGQTWFLAERTDRYKLVLAEKTVLVIETDGDRVLRARGSLNLIGF